MLWGSPIVLAAAGGTGKVCNKTMRPKRGGDLIFPLPVPVKRTCGRSKAGSNLKCGVSGGVERKLWWTYLIWREWLDRVARPHDRVRITNWLGTEKVGWCETPPECYLHCCVVNRWLDLLFRFFSFFSLCIFYLFFVYCFFCFCFLSFFLGAPITLCMYLFLLLLLSTQSFSVL